jgi:hypothetical protein
VSVLDNAVQTVNILKTGVEILDCLSSSGMS